MSAGFSTHSSKAIAMVEPEIRLYLHTFFRSHEDSVPVKVAVKRNALFFYLSELCQRENLKSAAVGQNGSVPMNELVKSARFRDKFVAGSDVQMICVAQKHLATERFQVVRADGAFYCARGSRRS